MAKLNYMDRENLLRELEVTEELITIGREATNKLVIADPSVSRQHAWVEKREDGYYLVDKNSSNGSFVNGKKVTQQKLAHNDKVQLGNAQLVFEDEEQVSATFILPREGLPSEITEPNKTQPEMSPDERPTSAVDVSEPLPVPPPKPQPPAPAPPPPAPVTPPPAAAPPIPPPPPAPRVESPQICGSCKKPIEPGARFCGSCGAPISAPGPKPFAPPPPMTPSPAARPPIPPPPAPSPVGSKPPAPPPPASFGGSVHPLTHGFQPPPVPSAAAPLRTGREEYAGFGPRLIAYLLDGLFMSLFMIPVWGLIALANFVLDPGPITVILTICAALLALIVVFMYWVFLTGKKGATYGKKMMKLKVVGADGTFPIGIGKAMIRILMQILGGAICGLTYWMILFDKEMKRGLHDKIAGTLVIRQL